MVGEVKAIYEGGVLRLLQPVALPEAAQVTVIIGTSEEGYSTRDWAAVERARATLAGVSNIPTVEEVRASLANFPGSWSADIVADRGEF